MPKKQHPFYCPCPGADHVVIFIHGIIEGPSQFYDLAPIAHRMGCSVLTLLLPGHGGKGEEFAQSSLQQWIDCLEHTLQDMEKKYPHIVLCGHSMGTLLAIHSAIYRRHPAVKGIFALNIPTEIFLRPRAFISSMAVMLNRVGEHSSPVTLAARDAYSIHTDHLWTYCTWLPRYLDLFHLIGLVRRRLSTLCVPLVAIQSARDEFIPVISLFSLKKKLKNCQKKLILLPNSGHFYFPQEERRLIQKEFMGFLRRMTKPEAPF